MNMCPMLTIQYRVCYEHKRLKMGLRTQWDRVAHLSSVFPSLIIGSTQKHPYVRDINVILCLLQLLRGSYDKRIWLCQGCVLQQCGQLLRKQMWKLRSIMVFDADMTSERLGIVPWQCNLHGPRHKSHLSLCINVLRLLYYLQETSSLTLCRSARICSVIRRRQEQLLRV